MREQHTCLWSLRKGIWSTNVTLLQHTLRKNDQRWTQTWIFLNFSILMDLDFIISAQTELDVGLIKLFWTSSHLLLQFRECGLLYCRFRSLEFPKFRGDCTLCLFKCWAYDLWGKSALFSIMSSKSRNCCDFLQ